jgi:plasmid stabilization system protein ParE
MISRFRIESGAKADISAAKDWYEAQRPGLELEFRDQLSAVFRRIESNPLGIAIVYRDVRQVALKQFPYVVSFVIRDEAVIVIAVLHGRRDETTWQERID